MFDIFIESINIFLFVPKMIKIEQNQHKTHYYHYFRFNLLLINVMIGRCLIFVCFFHSLDKKLPRDD